MTTGGAAAGPRGVLVITHDLAGANCCDQIRELADGHVSELISPANHHQGATP